MIPVITFKRFLCLSLILAIGFFSRSSFAQSVSDASACRADVTFLMDNTGSMGGPINSTKRNAQSILDAISGGDPRFAGIDTRYAVATYWGDPREYVAGGSSIWYCHRKSCPYSWCNRYICENPSGYCARYWPSQCISREPTEAQKKAAAQKAFRINQPLTDSKTLTRRGMNEWRPCSSPGGCGGDWAEANLFALQQLATGGQSTDGACIDPLYSGASCSDHGYASGYDVGWREDSGRIIVWFGDACSWSTTVDITEATKALQSNNVVVAGINSYSEHSGIDYYRDGRSGRCVWDGSKKGQATSITESTGGSLTNRVSGTAGTVNAILDAVAGGMAQSGSAAAVSFNVSSITEDTRVYQSFLMPKIGRAISLPTT
ncbi:vWA domain-containing protein [Arenicellales bacterium nBUS_45]